MIQIYKRENINYDTNGDMTLFPISCSLKSILNGAWELTLTHPLDDEDRWKYMEEEAMIAAPTWMGEKQLFRIDKVEKTDTEVTAAAYPVFFDSADDCFLLDTRPERKNGQQALDIMTAGTKYRGESDITEVSTAYFVRRNLMDAINGEDEPTFVQRWGGEILYDNYKIIINERVGGDYGTEIRYGKNMNGLNYQIDMSTVVTRIVPVSYNGYTLDGDAPWVDSPNIGKYAKIHTREMKFDDVKLREDANEDDEENGVIVCDNIEELQAALVEKCKEQYEAKVDVPAVTIDVSMLDLSRTEEYKEYEILERVGLGDTVHCYHSKLDITTEARVIELTWDCIRDVSEEIKLGDYEYNYFSELSSALDVVNKIVGPGNTVVAERVQGVLNAMNTQLHYQKNVAKKQDVRAILFEDLDRNSQTYGAMCLGTQGFQIANERTQDGRDWDWRTAFTAKGGYADVLITGLLADKTGRSFWDLGTGEIQLTGIFQQIDTDGKKSVDIKNNQVRFFDWEIDGKYVGSIGNTRITEDKRTGVAIWCEKGNYISIGYREATGKILSLLKCDTTSDEPPFIANTYSGTMPVSANTNYNITVKNGLIVGWENMKQISEKMEVGENGEEDRAGRIYPVGQVESAN